MVFCGLSTQPPPQHWAEARLDWQVCANRFHSGSVHSVAFCPQGKRIVSASGENDGLVKIWDAPSGAEVSSLVGMR